MEKLDEHLSESIGVRSEQARPVQLSPVPRAQDFGRRPLAGFGSVEIGNVMPDPHQPRTKFTEEAIQRLADSIRQQGQLMPIRVRWSEGHAKWLIVSGERRWRATRLSGLPTINCYFHDTDLSTSETLEQQLIENLLREDLKPIEEAKAYQELMALNGWTGKRVAEALNVPPSKVSRTLALLRLPEEVQAKINSGEIPARTAYELSRLADGPQRDALLVDALAGALTHQQATERVGCAKTKTKRPRKGKLRKRVRLTFLSQGGWRILVQAPRAGNYFEVEQALQAAIDEVRHRIANNVQLF